MALLVGVDHLVEQPVDIRPVESGGACRRLLLPALTTIVCLFISAQVVAREAESAGVWHGTSGPLG